MRHLFMYGILCSIALLSLSGCLVEESDPPKIINRSTNDVKPIVTGDYYEYEVRGQITNTDGSFASITGTLRVDYFTDSIYLPFGSSTQISVIREETVLNLGGSSYFTTRYIEQNPDGSLQVLAADSNSVKYRTGPPGGLLNELTPIVFLESPVPVAGSNEIQFQYLEGCEVVGGCSRVVTNMNESVTYTGNADIQTRVGRFNAIRYDYDAGTAAVISPFSALFDFRASCNPSSAKYNGSAYVFPEVGIVGYDYYCNPFPLTPGSTGHNFLITLISTNVTIPKP